MHIDALVHTPTNTHTPTTCTAFPPGQVTATSTWQLLLSLRAKGWRGGEGEREDEMHAGGRYGKRREEIRADRVWQLARRVRKSEGEMTRGLLSSTGGVECKFKLLQ